MLDLQPARHALTLPAPAVCSAKIAVIWQHAANGSTRPVATVPPGTTKRGMSEAFGRSFQPLHPADPKRAYLSKASGLRLPPRARRNYPFHCGAAP